MTPDDHQFPPYPQVEDLPAGLTERELHEFAFRLMTEHGEAIGDYLFAAVRQSRDTETTMRWARMAELIQQIYGSPITLTYRACDRIAAERGSPVETKH